MCSELLLKVYSNNNKGQFENNIAPTNMTLNLTESVKKSNVSVKKERAFAPRSF